MQTFNTLSVVNSNDHILIDNGDAIVPIATLAIGLKKWKT